MLSLNRERFIFKALTNCLKKGSVKELERRRGYYVTWGTTLKKASVLKSDKKLEEQKLNDASLKFTEQPFEENGRTDLFTKKVCYSSVTEVENLKIEENHSPKHESSCFLDDNMSDDSEKENFRSVNTSEIISSKGSVKNENSSHSQLSDRVFNESVTTTKNKVSSLDNKSKKVLSQSLKVLSSIENNFEKIQKFSNNIKDAELLVKQVSASSVHETKTSKSKTYISPRPNSVELVQNFNGFKIGTGTKRLLEEVASVVKSKKAKVTEKDKKYDLNPLNNQTSSSSKLKLPKRNWNKVGKKKNQLKQQDRK